MSRILSQLLGASEPMFSIMIEQLERASGNQSVDVQLTADVLKKAHNRMRQLGLDPNDTTAHELYAALMGIITLHDHFIAEQLGIKDPTNVNEVTLHIQTAVSKLHVPKSAWVMKTSVAKRLLKATPPKQVMKVLKYRSIDSMLKREPVAEVLGAARFIESPEWLHGFLAKYEKLSPSDFETRRVEVIRLDPEKWGKAAEAHVQSNRHNITHLKELGVVLILPMPVKHMRGATLTMLPLVLHYINEIRLYSSFFKMQQVKSTFGIIVARTLMHDPSDHIKIGRQQMHWRVVQRYYGLHAETHPEVFEPHVVAEDLAWRRAEDVLYRLEPALQFWQGMDYVGLLAQDGPVSFNLMDLAVSYANGLPYEYRSVGQLRRTLANELFVRYIAQPNLEHQVLSQLNNQMIDPGLTAMSMKGTR